MIRKFTESGCIVKKAGYNAKIEIMRSYRIVVSKPVTDIWLFELQKRKFLFWWKVVDCDTVPAWMPNTKTFVRYCVYMLATKNDISHNNYYVKIEL